MLASIDYDIISATMNLILVIVLTSLLAENGAMREELTKAGKRPISGFGMRVWDALRHTCPVKVSFIRHN